MEDRLYVKSKPTVDFIDQLIKTGEVLSSYITSHERVLYTKASNIMNDPDACILFFKKIDRIKKSKSQLEAYNKYIDFKKEHEYCPYEMYKYYVEKHKNSTISDKIYGLCTYEIQVLINMAIYFHDAEKKSLCNKTIERILYIYDDVKNHLKNDEAGKRMINRSISVFNNYFEDNQIDIIV